MKLTQWLLESRENPVLTYHIFWCVFMGFQGQEKVTLALDNLGNVIQVS